MKLEIAPNHSFDGTDGFAEDIIVEAAQEA